MTALFMVKWLLEKFESFSYSIFLQNNLKFSVPTLCKIEKYLCQSILIIC